MKYLFLVNPVSGRRAAVKLIPKIKDECEGRGLDYEIFVTGSSEDLRAKIHAAARSGNPLYIYVLGGDGSLFDAVNAAALHKNASVGIIPCGSGNDFVRAFGDKDAFLDIAAQLDGSSVNVDLISYNGVFALNVASLGMDAHVVAHQKRLPSKINGSLSYIISVFTAFVFNMNSRYKIIADGERLNGKYLFAVVSNGRYYGGGFCPAPHASIADGKLDLLLINAVSRRTVIRLMKKYREGRHLEIDGLCVTRSVKKVEIICEKTSPAELDGELFSAKSFVFEVIPRGLSLIIPRGTNFGRESCLYGGEAAKSGEEIKQI